MGYNLRTIRPPLLKRIEAALPVEILEMIYVLSRPRPRYALRPRSSA